MKLAGSKPSMGVRKNSSGVGRLEIGSDAVEMEALEHEGGLGLSGRVCFD